MTRPAPQVPKFASGPGGGRRGPAAPCRRRQPPNGPRRAYFAGKARPRLHVGVARVRVRRVRTQTAYRTPALLTQQEQLDVLGGLDAVLLQVLLDLLAAGDGRPLLRRRSAPHPAGSLRAKRRAGCCTPRHSH